MLLPKYFNYFKKIYLLFLLTKNLIFFPLNILYLISFLIPRKPNSWCIGGWEGEQFRGSCQYFYQFLKNKKNLEVYWITKNKNLFRKFNKKDKNFLYAFSILGFYHLLRSKKLIFSHGLYDFIPTFTGGSKKIMINHTTYPIKEMSFYKNIKQFHFLKKLFFFINSPFNYLKPDFEIVSSEKNKFGIFLDENNNHEKKRIIGLGLPKTDYLISLLNKTKLSQNFKLINKYFPNSNVKSKLILFLPTWRSEKSFSIFNFGYDNNLIQNFLKKHNLFLLVNFHPFDNNKITKKNIANNNRVKFLNLQNDEINNIFYLSDILMTDFSSIFSDFLIFDKEIVFAKFDYLSYQKERRIKVNYDKLPGFKITDWDEFTICISKILKDKSINKSLRSLYKYKIYEKNTSGDNCSNIFKFIANL